MKRDIDPAESLALRDDALKYEIDNADGDPTRYYPYYLTCGCSVRGQCTEHLEMSEELKCRAT